MEIRPHTLWSSLQFWQIIPRHQLAYHSWFADWSLVVHSEILPPQSKSFYRCPRQYWLLKIWSKRQKLYRMGPLVREPSFSCKNSSHYTPRYNKFQSRYLLWQKQILASNTWHRRKGKQCERHTMTISTTLAMQTYCVCFSAPIKSFSFPPSRNVPRPIVSSNFDHAPITRLKESNSREVWVQIVQKTKSR